MVYDAAQYVIAQLRALGIPAHLNDYSEGLRDVEGRITKHYCQAYVTTPVGVVHVKQWHRRRGNATLSRFEGRQLYSECLDRTIGFAASAHHRRARQRCPRVKAMRRARHARIVAAARELIGQIVKVPAHAKEAGEDYTYTIVPGVRIYPAYRPCVVRITGIKSRQYDVIHMDFREVTP
jgi:hypothetical protein